MAAAGFDFTKRPTNGYCWFHVWIGLGLVLAILLLISSISTYVLVSRRLKVDHLRGDLAAEVATLDRQFQRGRVLNAGQLAAMVRQTQERSNRRIAWIRIQNGEGATLAQAGLATTPSFSNQDVRSRIANRQPIFKVLNTGTGNMVVEVFPLRIPPTITLVESSATATPGTMRRQFGTAEVGAFLESDGVAMWPLERNLMINSSAALMLILSLAGIGMRLRSYVAGRQLEQEVEIARSVQRDLLPSPKYRLDGFELAADCVPAARVSGDFFDTFRGRDDRAAFVLGDVSGKGVPAAMLMGVMHGAVRSSAWTDSPAQHLQATQQINQLLYERAATERFATMFWSYFDPQLQHLKYINAGHCPPLLWKAAHRDTILRLTIGGPVLGLLPDAEYQTGSVRLEQGDILVLYSDGVIEAANPEDEEFGEQRMLAILSKCGTNTAEEIRDQILSSVEAFTGRRMPEDDRTLFVIAYSGAYSGDTARTVDDASPAGRQLAARAA